jgi:hypothetical protein
MAKRLNCLKVGPDRAADGNGKRIVQISRVLKIGKKQGELIGLSGYRMKLVRDSVNGEKRENIFDAASASG